MQTWKARDEVVDRRRMRFCCQQIEHKFSTHIFGIRGREAGGNQEKV